MKFYRLIIAYCKYKYLLSLFAFAAELPTCWFRSRFTLNHVLSALEENQLYDSQPKHDEIEVVVLPPHEDEDSDMCDDGATSNFIHLPRHILKAEAETPSPAGTAPAPEAQQQPAKRKKKAPRNWGIKKFCFTNSFQSQPAVMVHPLWVI